MNATHFLIASPFNFLIALAIIVAVWILYRHVNRRESERIHTTLDLLLYLSGTTILLGTLGFFLEMNRARCAQLMPGSSFVTIICTVPESTEQVMAMATCYGKSASVMLTGLLAAMIMALVWYIFKTRECRD